MSLDAVESRGCIWRSTKKARLWSAMSRKQRLGGGALALRREAEYGPGDAIVHLVSGSIPGLQASKVSSSIRREIC